MGSISVGCISNGDRGLHGYLLVVVLIPPHSSGKQSELRVWPTDRYCQVTDVSEFKK